MSEPLYETIEQLSTPRYAPRLKPTRIPTARWDEAPLYCLKVNDEWISHILGVLTALDQPDTWLGTSAQIYDARQQVNQIMVAFMEQCDDMSNCCPEPNRTRFTSDGSYQISYDGGTTWQDGSDLDPRYNSTQFPPIPGDDGDGKKCDAANSVLVQIKDKVETWEGMLSTAGTFLEFAIAAIAALAAGIFGGPSAASFIFGACLAIIKGCWDAGAEAYSLAFTDPVYNQLLCILYCHVEEDGTFTSADVAAVINDCRSTFEPIARDAFITAFTGWGPVGTTNAAAIGGGGLECDDCNCPEECSIDAWATGLWYQGAFYNDAAQSYNEIERGDDYVIIESADRGDGQQYLAFTSISGVTACCWHYEFIEGYAPESALRFYNDAPAHAEYDTMTQDNTGGHEVPVTQIAFQMSSGGPWRVKFTLVDCP